MSLKPPVGPSDHVQGPRTASVVLVEYGDFECPYCGAAYPELKAVQQALGDDMCFVFRNFPLSNAHPHAMLAAGFAEAAATAGRFWEMHDLLFTHQDALDEPSLRRYAQQLALGDEVIEAALSGKFEPNVRAHFSSGVRSGVNGTPCLFINGQRWEGPAEAAVLIPTLREIIARR